MNPSTVPLIVEQYTRAKTGREHDNEDAMAISEDGNLIVVIDGMTSHSETLINGATPGRFAAQTLAQHIRTHGSDISLGEAADSWQNVLKDALATAHTRPTKQADTYNPAPSAAAFVVAYNRTRNQIWRIGDSHIRIDTTQYLGSKEIDVITTEFRAALNHALILGGQNPTQLRYNDAGRKAAEPLYQAQAHLANRDTTYGYGVLDGQRPIPERYLETWDLPTQATVILASDGYPSCQPTWAEAEKELEHLIKEDPLGIAQLRAVGKATHPDNTHPDDRTYIRINHQR